VLILYLLLPLTLFMFAWKAAVFPRWGAGLLCLAIAASVVHLAIPLRRVSWRSKVALCVGAGLVSAGVIAVVGTPRRSFDLFRADLSNQWLFAPDLKGANLRSANLKGAYLHTAHLEGANLFGARLDAANLFGAHLEGADLSVAHLEGAILIEAQLDDANLMQAQLEGATLGGAHFARADLFGAHLARANLRLAYLDGADLRQAHLEGANLRDTEGLTQAQIEEAEGDVATRLPEGLTRPVHWTTPTAGAAPAR
jgi:uncharacterized protein YjbI with pentapeptide repeats